MDNEPQIELHQRQVKKPKSRHHGRTLSQKEKDRIGEEALASDETNEVIALKYNVSNQSVQRWKKAAKDRRETGKLPTKFEASASVASQETINQQARMIETLQQELDEVHEENKTLQKIVMVLGRQL